MKKISYDDKTLSATLSAAEQAAYAQDVHSAERMLAGKSGMGSDFLGWLDLPKKSDGRLRQAIAEKAAQLADCSDVLICIGIGGSYLGARAAVEFLCTSFDDQRSKRVIFAGHHLSSDYLSDLKSLIDSKNVAVNVISKSGTTTEPGVVFRIVRQWMEQRYGVKGASERIVATTDPSEGALRALSSEKGYATFPIPPDIGGRFSVLTAVGLLPIAYAGIDIERLMQGAEEAMAFCAGGAEDANIAARYAVNRNLLFRRGKMIEVLATFQPHLHFIGEWWKQLAGESEGKNLTGIFPAVLDYTTDLHSLGQWMQEGVRNVFETFIVLKGARTRVDVPELGDDHDGLGYLRGKSLEYINESAYKGTLLAHLDGTVPVATISVEDRSEESLGQLFYFFEKAIAISGYLLRVNPFDQPGVEAYKKNMFALLAKPGHEARGKELRGRLNDLGL